MRAAVKHVHILGLLAALIPGVGCAFTAEGHRVVGEIAEARLCAPARDYLAPLLQGNSLANAGVWADAIRDDPAWSHTLSWHYINVADQASMRAAARQPGNVLSAIARAERDLADRRLPLEKRAEALRFFVHFLADLHQPLHVGRAEDRGGNDIEVRWGRETLSLHELWDGRRLLKAEGLPTRALAESIGALALGQGMTWSGGSALDWAEESRTYRPLVYGFGRPDRAKLEPAYIAMARNVVSQRLAQAGVRLAVRLNRLACPGRDAAPSR